MKFRLSKIQIDRVSNQSGLYYGRNRQQGLQKWCKQNDGFGNADPDNANAGGASGKSSLIAGNVAIVFDEDGVDSRVVPDGGIRNEQLE